MVAKLAAVQGMTVEIDQSSAVPPSPDPPPPPPIIPAGIQATIVVSAPTGTKVKAEAKLVHRDGDSITVSGITVPSAGATTPDAGPYTVSLNATVTKTKAEGVKVLRVEDISDTINAVPIIPGSPPVNYPVAFNCVISNAGQIKVKVD
jgi:hypothetical protein